MSLVLSENAERTPDEGFTFHTIQYTHLPSKNIIFERVVIDGTPPEGFARFVVLLTAPIGVSPSGQPLKYQKEFALRAETPAEAMRMVPALIHEQADGLAKEGLAMLKRNQLRQNVLDARMNGHG